jgi:hypothetical protein
MNKAKLKTYAPQARKDFIAVISARANALGLAENSGKLHIATAEKSGDLVSTLKSREDRQNILTTGAKNQSLYAP